MKRIILCGAGGRMGTEVIRQCAQAGFEIACGVDAHPFDAPFPVYPSIQHVKTPADVLVDFSSPDALLPILQYAKAHRLPCVLCATGYAREDLSAIQDASLLVPIFQSANMSVGVYVLKTLAAQARKMLAGFDVEIIERHHRMKADAPSGTALMLFNAVKGDAHVAKYGRDAQSGARTKDEIGIHAVRGGTLAGEHEVAFLGESEVVTLLHSAQSRGIFAAGALKAADFLLTCESGLYNMDDMMKKVLG